MTKFLFLSLAASALALMAACSGTPASPTPGASPTPQASASPSASPIAVPTIPPTASSLPEGSLADVANQNLLGNPDAEASPAPNQSIVAIRGWTGEATATAYGSYPKEFSEGWGLSRNYGSRYFRQSAEGAGDLSRHLLQTLDLTGIRSDIDNNFVGFRLQGDLSADKDSQNQLEVSFYDQNRQLLSAFVSQELEREEHGGQTLDKLYSKGVGSQVPDGARLAVVGLYASCHSCGKLLSVADNLSFTLQPIR